MRGPRLFDHTDWNGKKRTSRPRAGGRAADSGGPSVYQGRPKFEMKHKSRCLQRSRPKYVNWAGKHVGWGGQAFHSPH